MDTIGIGLDWCIMVGLVAVAWALPRKLGLFGLLGHHLITVLGWMVMAQIALVFGVWLDHDILTFIGCLIQAFLFNCLLLPVSVTAMLRFGKENERSLDSSPSSS